LIPAGTGLREYQSLIVGDKDEMERAGVTDGDNNEEEDESENAPRDRDFFKIP
jgi:hypothetical protein